jgi:hypothetical protein
MNARRTLRNENARDRAAGGKFRDKIELQYFGSITCSERLAMIQMG